MSRYSIPEFLKLCCNVLYTLCHKPLYLENNQINPVFLLMLPLALQSGVSGGEEEMPPSYWESMQIMDLNTRSYLSLFEVLILTQSSLVHQMLKSLKLR